MTLKLVLCFEALQRALGGENERMHPLGGYSSNGWGAVAALG